MRRARDAEHRYYVIPRYARARVRVVSTAPVSKMKCYRLFVVITIIELILDHHVSRAGKLSVWVPLRLLDAKFSKQNHNLLTSTL